MPNGTGLTARKVSKSRELHEPIRHILAVGIKPGTTRGSPRRSRTAKASRISRHAVKSRCACEWGAWGRISDDGTGQHNPNRSEGPWGKATNVA